jgi:RNA polymerase sigma-70 factor, ECF subfamily
MEPGRPVPGTGKSSIASSRSTARDALVVIPPKRLRTVADLPTSKSLLAQAGDRSDQAAWRRLMELYQPLVERWVRPHVAQRADAEDVTQEVLTALVTDLPRFAHNQRPGAFRAWLRTITLHRLRRYWEKRDGRPAATGDPRQREALAQLADPASALSRAWDEEHDRHVTRTLLASIRLEFQPATWRAFERQVQDGCPAADVAEELGMSVNAALIAKSRVLKRLREKAVGLVDDS